MAKYRVLDLFYKSKEWQAFRTAYIHDRIKQDNGSRCDYCGGWIDNAEHVTLHHIEELTPSNVGEAMIALNPDNIKQVHKTCHNTIEKHAAEKARRVFIVYGPPMAGKKTYVKQRAWPGDLIVDIDAIYKAITGLPMYEKPNALYYNAVAIQDLLLDHIKTRYGRWDNAWIIGGYPDRYKRERLANEVGAESVLITAPKEVCISRLKMDADRRVNEGEWTTYIEKWFERHTN
jgi:predicted kinase